VLLEDDEEDAEAEPADEDVDSDVDEPLDDLVSEPLLLAAGLLLVDEPRLSVR
jgi:hypothetical protein